MDEGTIQSFSKVLEAYPAGFSGNRLNLLFVDNAKPITNKGDYLRRLDDLSLVEEQREYLIDEQGQWPFPRIYIYDRPDPWLLSHQLFTRFDHALSILPRQQDIGQIIESHVRRIRPSVVALVIVDGLSYYDLPDDVEATPLLVSGVSTTSYGYRAVIGDPPISRRMFALGYMDQLAFTYYPAIGDNLSSQIHSTFSTSQVIRVKGFEEALKHLHDTHFRYGYLQIVLSGLDQICHAHHDQPPRDQYIKDVLLKFDALVSYLKETSNKYLACMVSDHGILWRDVVEDRLQIADDLYQDESYHPRYIKGSILRPYGKNIKSHNQNFTLLGTPWMTRKFKNNEWGVHGGISAWESIVPLFIQHA